MITDLIKKCAVEAVEVNVPFKLTTGTVIKRNKERYPKAYEDKDLIIQADTKLQLTLDFLLFTETSGELECKTGDKIFLFRVQGGQRYVVWDKIKVV